MKITLSNPDNQYGSFIDTDVMDVLITEAYIGPTFISDNGEELIVLMRDNGFEIIYTDTEDVVQTWSLNDGFVRRLSLKGKVIPFPTK